MAGKTLATIFLLVEQVNSQMFAIPMQKTKAATMVAPISAHKAHVKKRRPTAMRRSATATLILTNMALTA
jgi:hypothetical protein